MSPKQSLNNEFALIAKALAHPHRLNLIEHAAQGAMPVEMLAERTGLSVANASQHLRQLREAGLVTAEREGKFVRYGLADDAVLDLLASLQRVAESRRAAVGSIVSGYIDARDTMEPISRAELMARVREGTVTVLDVRPCEEYALGHVPGALCVPLDQLDARLAELDPTQSIVAYCRGPWCVLSFEAVAKLRAHGFDARRLEAGYPEWRAAGLPVA
ncbi:MAG: ArsR family transcriptional regulator [Pseudomonadales bacterium]|jgi:ArsR family transcriptional regulator|nr:ArsR family transcriptional regulator [Pseudomonadales bacterium]